MADLTPVKPEITKVSSLTSDSFGERWKICVKVKNKSGKSSLENGTDYFKVVLEDDSGQIEALAFGSQNIHRFFDRFEENKLYFISDGKLTVNENVPNEEQPCDEGPEEKEKRHPCQIHLESGTVVTCSGEENQPRSPFTPVTQLKQSTKTFVDVVGIVTGVWKLEMKYTQYRSINITDENGSDVNVALWGKLATEFDVKSISSVVSLKNVRVKKENGEVELQSTPNTEIEYKPSDPEAIVLREIHGIAEIVDELSDDMRDSEDDASHCRGCQKRRRSNSPACHRKRNDSGTSTGRGKCNKNNLTNGAICRRRGSGPGRGRRGRRNYSFDGNRTGRGRGRRRSVTNNDDFIDDEEESDIEDSEVDDLREYKKKRRPVRHCTRKSTTSVADDDNSDSDDDTDDTDDDVDDDDAIDNDKEDANEENGMKTRRRGRPCKRSLDKELDGASKTSSGRLTRLRQKSTTDSPKKASSSLQGPVTVISIETDEESDDDGIKPVSSAKKASKMYSSDDSDATVSYLETSNSSGKRKASDNDDGEDDDKSNDEKDVTKSSKKSSKKKFKRIKTTCTSSQETEKSVDQEEKDGDEHSSGSSGSDTDSSSSSSSSDTHSYHSGHGDMDGMWVEESPVESSYIQQLRAIQKDDDGTLNLLQHYILWFALKAGGEDCDDEFYKETVDAKTKLDGRLEVVMNICQSQAWGVNFRKDVKAYPQFNDYVKHEDLSGGDMRHLGNCEVCNRENHPWSVIVRLEGEPYNRETFEMVVKEEEEDMEELPPVQYYMGCFCHPRTKLFHNLYHFGHYLYHRCKEMLEDLDDDKKKIDTVATDESLFNEMYTKLKKWMNEAETDYTEDGERANNKWTREYNF